MKSFAQKYLTKSNLIRAAVVIIAAAVCIAGIIALNAFDKVPLVSTEGRTFEKARVEEITKDNLQEDGNRYGNQELMLYIKTGEYAGQTLKATSPNGTLFGAGCTVGMDVVAIISANEGGTPVITVYSQDREYIIYIFAALFVMCLWLVGGRKGLKSAFCLGVTLILTLFVYFPLVYRGFPAFWAAVIICIIATLLTIFTVSGVNVKSVAAVCGTAFGVLVAGVTAVLFGAAAGINGYNVSEVESLLFVAQGVPLDVGGLLFSGIIISSLGAVMDVGMSLASTIAEIYEKRPELSVAELFKSGINVGRDMMGTMSNTLILAFVGGSVAVLMLNYSYDLPYYQLINSYSIGIEIMQGLSGSIGIVLTVPFTSLLAAVLIKKYKRKVQP